MGNSIENPFDSRSRRLQRLLRSGLILLAPLVALMPQSAHAQIGVKEVMGAEAVRPVTDFADRPLRIYNVPGNLAESLRGKGADIVAGTEAIRTVNEVETTKIPVMVRSLIVAGEALTQEIQPVGAETTSGN